ncbi:hypothetical protein Gohar_001548 [Gossypium harknessii]|uniref:Uncharacterized protein n=1 Tax=Gossypium harknessii TaxID=34285 RepID=A0A7J9I4B6_9ROSI|nr:hypothetical protein [Gossypium harknessii]
MGSQGFIKANKSFTRQNMGYLYRFLQLSQMVSNFSHMLWHPRHQR